MLDNLSRACYHVRMEERHSRTALLIGEHGVEKLKKSRVAVFGLGGVGSYCAEALVRAGVGSLTFIDKDKVEESNINRQLVANYSTIGRYKAEVMKARALDISPEAEIIAYNFFYLPETAGGIPLGEYDYIADCIDNVTAKLHLIENAKRLNIPVVSAMGAGNRLDPAFLRAGDISETSICPLARVVRRELAKRGIREGVKVVWSEEPPVVKSETVGSVSFVPSAMGLMMAGSIVRDLIK